jgi:hypothetical protein
MTEARLCHYPRNSSTDRCHRTPAEARAKKPEIGEYAVGTGSETFRILSPALVPKDPIRDLDSVADLGRIVQMCAFGKPNPPALQNSQSTPQVRVMVDSRHRAVNAVDIFLYRVPKAADHLLIGPPVHGRQI